MTAYNQANPRSFFSDLMLHILDYIRKRSKIDQSPFLRILLLFKGFAFLAFFFLYNSSLKKRLATDGVVFELQDFRLPIKVFLGSIVDI